MISAMPSGCGSIHALTSFPAKAITSVLNHRLKRLVLTGTVCGISSTVGFFGSQSCTLTVAAALIESQYHLTRERIYNSVTVQRTFDYAGGASAGAGVAGALAGAAAAGIAATSAALFA